MDIDEYINKYSHVLFGKQGFLRCGNFICSFLLQPQDKNQDKVFTPDLITDGLRIREDKDFRNSDWCTANIYAHLMLGSHCFKKVSLTTGKSTEGFLRGAGASVC